MLGIEFFGLQITGRIILLILALVALIQIKKVGSFIVVTAQVLAIVVAATTVLTTGALLVTMPSAWAQDATGSWWVIAIMLPTLLALPALVIHTARSRQAWSRNPFNGNHSPLRPATFW
jgi:hypothetical protein